MKEEGAVEGGGAFWNGAVLSEEAALVEGPVAVAVEAGVEEGGGGKLRADDVFCMSSVTGTMSDVSSGGGTGISSRARKLRMRDAPAPYISRSVTL